MDALTSSTRIYLAAVSLAALLVTAWLAVFSGTLWDADPLYLVLIAAMAMLAYRFPISFGFKRRIYLDVVAIGSAVMLLDPGPGALAVGVGAIVGQLLKTRAWDECVFNAAQAMLQTIAGGALLVALNWEVHGLFSLTPAALLSLFALTLTVYTINSVLLAGIIGLQSGISPLAVLADSGTSIVELTVQATQIAAAIVATVLIMTSVWLAALLIVPCGALYVLLKHNVQKQKFAIINMLETLADLVDFRDPYTATHARRVEEISRRLSIEMNLPQEQVDLVSMAARFHNLGSLTIPGHAGTAIGNLRADNWNIMRQVPSMSADLLYQFPETALAGELVRHHLERFDGEGYPDGLAGDAIPLGSRIIAVADSVDSMLQHRVYRPAMAEHELRSELERYSGTQWDPAIISVVLEMVDSGALRLARPNEDPESQPHARSVTSSRTIEQQIQHQAFHDPLTDLPNRLLLMNRLSRGLMGDGRSFAVLFIDLDGFKSVNDMCGHRAGDHLLVEASRRIGSELGSDDLMARLGGDEFVVILPAAKTTNAAEIVAYRLIDALAAPLKDFDPSIVLGASIGIAMAKPGKDSPDEVLHRADSAMYKAKRNGRGRAAVATEDLAGMDLATSAAG